MPIVGMTPYTTGINALDEGEYMRNSGASAGMDTGSTNSRTIPRSGRWWSPVWLSQTPRSSAANSFTCRYSS